MSLQRNFAARLGHFRSNKLTSEEHSDVIFSYAGRFQAVNVNSCVFVYTFTSLNDDPNEPELSTTFTHRRSDFSPAAALFLIDWAAAAHLCSYAGCRGADRTYVGRLRTPSTDQPSRGRRQLLALYSLPGESEIAEGSDAGNKPHIPYWIATYSYMFVNTWTMHDAPRDQAGRRILCSAV